MDPSIVLQEKRMVECEIMATFWNYPIVESIINQSDLVTYFKFAPYGHAAKTIYQLYPSFLFVYVSLI